MKRNLALLCLIFCMSFAHAEDVYLLDSIIRVDESTGFTVNRTLFTYNTSGNLILRSYYYELWNKWKVGVPKILNRQSVIVYNDEGIILDRYSSVMDTATGIWEERHPYIYDENHNIMYNVQKWNDNFTVILTGVRYYYDEDNFETGYESFDTWNGVKVLTHKLLYHKDISGLRGSMIEFSRPDSAYEGDYMSDPEKFNQSGWVKIDSAHYDYDEMGNKTMESNFRWDDEHKLWVKDGYQIFEYDEAGHSISDTVFARDWETNEITYNNMTVRTYDSHGQLSRSQNYYPKFTDGTIEWIENGVYVYDYTYNEDGMITGLRDYTDWQTLYSTTTYYVSTYYYSLYSPITTTASQLHNDNMLHPRKILYDGQLLILRDGKTYSMQGQEVR